jgi:hypothetical protein
MVPGPHCQSGKSGGHSPRSRRHPQRWPRDPVNPPRQLHRHRIHRGNYTATGPQVKQLQLIWWEFPPEHWTALRKGSRMNFLVTPESRENPNAPMDQEQLDVASAFVDELLEIGVLKSGTDGMKILLNAPLFVVPKEGQEGEWQVIAGMLRGGQNACMGSDPVYLPRSGHILDQMYHGGYSAVVDASGGLDSRTWGSTQNLAMASPQGRTGRQDLAVGR